MNNIAPIQQTKPDASITRFVPYGSADEIKLSIKIVQEIIAVPTRSGATCSTREALKFIAMCQARKLNPFEGDAYLIGYDSQNGPSFSLITAHQAFLKRAELHPEFDGMESGIVVTEGESEPRDIPGDFHLPNQTVVGGWARVHYKTRKIPTYRRIRLARFNTGRAEWAKDPAGMICKCAEADALRSSFPTLLAGMYMDDSASIDVGPSKRNDDTNGSGLVEVISRATKPAEPEDEGAEGEAGLAPATPEPPVKEPPNVAETAQQQLAGVLEQAGIAFPAFQRWAETTGQIKDADSLPDFDAVYVADAERILRALRGAKTRQATITQLTACKEQLL